MRESNEFYLREIVRKKIEKQRESKRAKERDGIQTIA